MTSSSARMATSSMLSSGSLVVKFCSHRPGRARQPRLVAKDRLMLRAVVLEHAVDVLLLGAQDHVSEEDHELDDGFDQIVHRRALDIRVDKAGQKRRQQEKEQDRQPQRQKNRQRRDEFLHFFVAELFFKPLVEFARLGDVLVGEIVRRKHQRLDALDHRIDERHRAADDG